MMAEAAGPRRPARLDAGAGAGQLPAPGGAHRQSRRAQLSGGEQQMLTIGRALMTNPALLILDEATEGLAPLMRAEIWRVIRLVKASGMACVIVDKNVTTLLDLGRAERHPRERPRRLQRPECGAEGAAGFDEHSSRNLTCRFSTSMASGSNTCSLPATRRTNRHSFSCTKAWAASQCGGIFRRRSLRPPAARRWSTAGAAMGTPIRSPVRAASIICITRRSACCRRFWRSSGSPPRS